MARNNFDKEDIKDVMMGKCCDCGSKLVIRDGYRICFYCQVVYKRFENKWHKIDYKVIYPKKLTKQAVVKTKVIQNKKVARKKASSDITKND